jgi:hypothetical protein
MRGALSQLLSVTSLSSERQFSSCARVTATEPTEALHERWQALEGMPDARQVLRLDAGSLLHNAEQLTLASHQASAIGEHARATDLALHADRCLQSALTTTVASMRRDEQTAAAHSNWSERLRCSSRPSNRPQSHGRLGETAHRLQWNAGTNPISDRLVYESWHGRRRLQGPCPSETRVRNQRLSLGAVHEF